MEKNMIFAVLGIAETKNEDEIKSAYRAGLAGNNPEDDPEGFRRLREAYEQALALARQKEGDGQEEEEDTTPAGQWMRRVREVYTSLPRRIDSGQWKELLMDDVCVDLEYGEEVKWRLFRYLADAYQLKSEIYRLLDGRFGIREGEAEFREHLPDGFVDYMLRRIADEEGENDFPYEWYTGPDNADYDTFQGQLYELEECLSEGDGGKAKQLAAAMESSGIDHPYYRLARARLAAEQGDLKAADEAGELVASYPDSPRILNAGAGILYQCGKKEEAVEIFRQVAERFGNFYMAEKHLAVHEKEQGKLTEAIRHCLNALENTADQELDDMLKELDAAYIEQCREALAAGTLAQEDADRVCISYIRAGRNQEGIDFLLTHPEYADQMEDMHKYLCTLYYRDNRMQESIEESLLWREEALARLQDMEEEDKDDGNWQLALTWSYQGKAEKKLAGDEEAGSTERTEGYKRARTAFDEAQKLVPDHPNLMQDVLDMMILDGEYENASGQADRILAINEEWFPALVQKQRACYELDRAQEVVDLFYRAKEVYEKYAPVYELAAQTFLDYGQFGDAKDIFEQAAKAEVTSHELELLEIHMERLQCKTDVSYFDALRKALALLEKFQSENAEKRTLAGLYYEMSIIEDCQYYEQFKHPGKGMEYIQKAISLVEGEPSGKEGNYYFTYGCFLQEEEKYREAIAAFEVSAKCNGMTEMTAVNLAECRDGLGEWEEAISCYEKALEINPEQEFVNGRIASIYRREGIERDSIPLLRRALPYADAQIERKPESAYFYRIRGIIYNALGDYERATADADRAIRLEKNEPYGPNLKGRILFRMRKYQQALFYFKKAIACPEVSESGEEWGIFANAAECYQKMGKYDEAEEWYRKGIRKYEGNKEGQGWFYWELIQMFRELGRYEEALALLEESFRKENMAEERYQLRRIRLKFAVCSSLHTKALEQASAEDVKEVQKQEKALEQEISQLAQKYDSIDMWDMLADVRYFLCGEEDAACETRRMVMDRIEKSKDWWDKEEYIVEWMRVCRERGDMEEVEKWGRYYIEGITGHYCYSTEEYPPVEQYLNDPDDSRQNYSNMIIYWICIGDSERAQEGLRKLREMNGCRDCRRNICVEYGETYAIYCEASGDPETAYEYYKKSAARKPHAYISGYKVRKYYDNRN